MAIPRSFLIYLALHSAIFVGTMVLVFAAIERERELQQIFIMSVAMVAPWLLLGISVIVFSSSFEHTT